MKIIVKNVIFTCGTQVLKHFLFHGFLKQVEKPVLFSDAVEAASYRVSVVSNVIVSHKGTLCLSTTAFPESNRIMVTHKYSGNKLNIKGNKDGRIV